MSGRVSLAVSSFPDPQYLVLKGAILNFSLIRCNQAYNMV
jgi:hypothetical protein